MTEVQELVGERQSPWLHLEYNARGERVMWRYDDSVILYGTGSYFLYDESGQLLNRFSPAWGNPDSGADKLRAGKTGQPAYFNETVWLNQTPVAQVQSTEGEVTLVHLIHSDHLNTPRALLNARTQGEQNAGTVVWRWKLNQQTPTGSNAFGALPAESDPDGNNVQVRFDLRFPGQQLDPETGLYYNYFRDYEPSTGRYVESDPIGLRGGVSTYGYVYGAPLAFADPHGLSGGTTFNPELNANPSWLLSNNCYSYALNRSGSLGGRVLGGGGTQPGAPSGDEFNWVTCEDLRAAAKRDGAVEPASSGECGGACPEGYRKIRLVITDNIFSNDYHWFRQDADGSWSSKPGAAGAQSHGRACPTAPWDQYKIDCGALCVKN